MKQFRFALATSSLLPAMLYALAFIWTAPVHAADVRAALAATKLREEQSDFSVSGHLVRVDERGTRTSEGIAIRARWFPGGLHVMVEIDSPVEARVHILMLMQADGQNEIQVAHPGDTTPETLPFDKWTDGPLGPSFSYEDFLEPQYFWPNQLLLEKTKYGARDCDVVKSEPGREDRTHYAGIKTWLDRSIGFPVYVEKTLKGTGGVKQFTYFGLRQNDGVWSASQIESKVPGKAGSILLIIDKGSAKANLGLDDFSPERLLHF
jgi:hypothetical protein